MRLSGKHLLMVVSDGVEYIEYLQIRKAFEEEGAEILVTCPDDHTLVESVLSGNKGNDIVIDLPFATVHEVAFDGLVIPDGILSTETLRSDEKVVELVGYFHSKRLPIFVSGNAVQLLYDSKAMFERVVVREGTPVSAFLDRAVAVLLDASGKPYLPTIAA